MTSSFRIYDRNGHPMVVQPPTAPDTVGAADDGFAKAYATEVSKRVRTRAVTMNTIVDRDRGRQKPTPVTYETLRLMARRNEWVRAIINRRKRQIAGVKWDIVLKDTDDPSGAAAKAAKGVRKLLERPTMHGSDPKDTHWQQWLGMLLGDLYELDRMCAEKERDRTGWIIALYPVDGSTIRPNLDDRGAFYPDDAYIQVVDGVREAAFPLEDMMVGIYNPQTDVNLAGYGLSPLETLIVSVTADLHAAKYNSEYFTSGNVPEGIINLGEDVDPEAVDAFRHYWMTEITGKPWSTPIIGGSKAPDWISWRDSNRDMQFMEYQQWLLQKMCAVFEIDQKDLGQIADVNRATADSQDGANERVGIQPVLEFLKHWLDLEVIGEHGQGLGDYLEFQWEETGESAEAINAKFAPMHQAGVAAGSEWREAHGMDPDGDPGATHGKEGLRMHLTAGEQRPLPSGKDADVLGAAASQQREDEQQQQQFEREDHVSDREHERQQQAEGGGQASQVPWQPADGDDPKTRQAMSDHDRESGVGPRNVGKTHPAAGHDRNPAVTRQVTSLEDVLITATENLARQLAEVLD